jgi:hypothetical protein
VANTKPQDSIETDFFHRLLVRSSCFFHVHHKCGNEVCVWVYPFNIAMTAQPRTSKARAFEKRGNGQGHQNSPEHKAASAVCCALNVGLVQNAPSGPRAKHSPTARNNLCYGWQKSEPRIMPARVLPNLGGISGQLTKTTRGNHTAGQTVRLPHTE